MIAPREKAYQVLSLGLQPQEQSVLEKICAHGNGEWNAVNDEMDLYRIAQTGTTVICVIGQSDTVPEPSYIAWLLREIVSPSRIVLLYSSLSEEEAKKVERYKVSNVLNRPLDPRHLARAIDAAFQVREERKESLFSSLSRLNPFRRQSVTH